MADKELSVASNAAIEKAKYLTNYLNLTVKCVYTSKWSPCDFCTTRNINTPCYKLRGPKTENRVAIYRPVATPINAVIDAKDALVLQYVYSDQMRHDFGYIRTYFRLLGVEYGVSIYPDSLRHAVLAFATASLPASQFSYQQIYHEQAAIAALMRLNGETIQEHDVCAAFVLTWMSHTYQRAFEALTHAKGCITMWQDLVTSPAPRAQRSDWISVFIPFMISLVDLVRVVHMLRDRNSQWSVPIRWTTFNHRLKFHGQLLSCDGLPLDFCRLDSISGLLYSHGLMLSNVILRLLSDSTEEVNKRRIIADILHLVKTELSDPNLLSFLQSSGIGMGPSDEGTIIPEDTLSRGYIFHELKSNCLLMAILEAPSVQEGLLSHKVMSLAKMLVRSFQSVSEQGRQPRISFFVDKPRFGYYFWHLLYAGLGLQIEESPQLCTWIIDELIGMGLPDKAVILETFWDKRTDSEVQDVIRACFGHPHRDYIGLNGRQDIIASGP